LLTSLLPGIRELRTPLAIGYVWLISAWLILEDRIPRERPPEGELAALWDLGTAAGTTAILAAVTFAAYLIGSILEIDPQGRIGQAISPIFLWKTNIAVSRNLISVSTIQSLLNHLQQIPGPPPLRSKTEGDPEGRSDERKQVVQEMRRLGLDRLSPLPMPTAILGMNRILAFMQIVFEEIPQIATRLQVNNAELFGKYDRLLAEASLRVNVAPPVTVLLMLIIWQSQQPVWQRFGLTIIVIALGYTIARQGFLKLIAARDVIVQALLSIDEVRSRAIEELTKKNPLEA
jgi:hypothetical protein